MNADAGATVFVPTLDGGERLIACLTALREQTRPVPVVVVDNGPGEGSREMLEARFPEVERVGFGSNLGFGPGLNRAVSQSAAGPIVLLNDDAVPRPDFLEALLAERGGQMTAAVLLRENDPSRIDSAGVLCDQTLMGFDYLCGEPVEALESAPPPIGPTGGAALYEREAFDAVGGFDDRIFLYYEDLDLALRIRAYGGTCALAAGARATHAHSATLGPRTSGKYAMSGWSRGYLLRRYGITASAGSGAGALAREVAICAGQVVRDRTTAGLTARVRGWRAARNLPLHRLPEGQVTRMSVTEALRRRALAR